MNTEDKYLIDNYIDQSRHGVNTRRKYDSNLASVCVLEMQNQNDWDRFLNHCYVHNSAEEDFIAYLFIANNFFKSFVEWRKEVINKCS